MPLRLGRPTLKRKLILLALAVSATVFLCSAITLLAFERRYLRTRTAEGLNNFTNVAASQIKPLLMKGDFDGIHNSLKALLELADVTAIILETPEGEVIFGNTKSPLVTEHPGTRLPSFYANELFDQGDTIIARRQIVGREVVLGTLILQQDFSRARQHISDFAQVLVLIFIGGLLLALLLALRLQETITKPLGDLATVAKEIRQSKDFSLRVQAPQSFDELGDFISSFNSMIEEIELRDAQLRESHTQLEARVIARTKELQHEHEQLKSVIMNAPVAMVMCDMSQRIMACSDRWRLDFEIPYSDARGKTLQEALPYLPEAWKNSFAQALNGAKIQINEERIERPEMPPLYLRWAVQAWYESDGAPGGLIIASSRIDNLVEAREAALQSAQIRSQFLANVSHELRTPMNAVIGFAELLFESPITPQQKEFLEAIQHSARTQLALINDVLDFAKLESRKVTLEVLQFKLRDVLERTISILGISSAQKGLTIETTIDERVPLLLQGDPLRLQQILTNLISNAIKFTEKGKIELFVSLQRLSKEQATLFFSVRDSGIGVPDEKLASLFKAFSQADGSITRRYGGTGLGLAISAELVQLMGGTIGVASTVGEGSSFYFTANFDIPATLTVPAEQGQQPEMPTVVAASSALRVLVAEDNILNQKLVATLLQRAGHEVTLAGNGAIALQMLNENNFDVVVMDLQMPEMGGIDAVKALRAKEQADGGPRIPVVALTAHAFEEDRHLCLSAGMDAYLSKPIQRSELLTTIERLARERR